MLLWIIIHDKKEREKLIMKKLSNILLFLEKLSFQESYQVIQFDNRIELNDYLMNKHDVSWGKPTAKPFIIENDELLEGYRENPNNPEDN